MVRSSRPAGGGESDDRHCAAEPRQCLEHQGRRGRGAGIPHQLGAGVWIYLGRDGETLVILLTGGTKQRQDDDIKEAQQLWAECKRRRQPMAVTRSFKKMVDD